jgi:transposase
MENTKKQYSLEFKLKAVELIHQRGSIIEVARELGVNRDTLKNWKNGRYIGTSDSLKLKSKEQEENIRLRKELHEVKLERDILKKAVGIFSKSDK